MVWMPMPLIMILTCPTGVPHSLSAFRRRTSPVGLRMSPMFVPPKKLLQSPPPHQLGTSEVGGSVRERRGSLVVVELDLLVVLGLDGRLRLLALTLLALGLAGLLAGGLLLGLALLELGELRLLVGLELTATEGGHDGHDLRV